MALCENFDFQNKGFFFMHIWVARYEFSESVNKSRVQIIELEMNGGINYEKLITCSLNTADITVIVFF